MKGVNAKLTRAFNLGSYVLASDNSGARIVKIVSVKGGKTRKGKQTVAGDEVGDFESCETRLTVSRRVTVIRSWIVQQSNDTKQQKIH